MVDGIKGFDQIYEDNKAFKVMLFLELEGGFEGRDSV